MIGTGSNKNYGFITLQTRERALQNSDHHRIYLPEGQLIATEKDSTDKTPILEFKITVPGENAKTEFADRLTGMGIKIKEYLYDSGDMYDQYVFIVEGKDEVSKAIGILAIQADGKISQEDISALQKTLDKMTMSLLYTESLQVSRLFSKGNSNKNYDLNRLPQDLLEKLDLSNNNNNNNNNQQGETKIPEIPRCTIM